MEYDRVRIKLAAKAAVRQGSPRPWLVTLIYLLLTQALVSAVPRPPRFRSPLPPGPILPYGAMAATSAAGLRPPPPGSSWR